jgi:hypothetical protein
VTEEDWGKIEGLSGTVSVSRCREQGLLIVTVVIITIILACNKIHLELNPQNTV